LLLKILEKAVVYLADVYIVFSEMKTLTLLILYFGRHMAHMSHLLDYDAFSMELRFLNLDIQPLMFLST